MNQKIDRVTLVVIDIALSAPVLLVLSVIDLWILIVITLKRQLHSYSNYFLANLVFSELLYVFVMVPMETVLQGVSTPHRRSCGSNVLYILIHSCIYTGYFHCAVCFSADKYIKISRPLKYATIVTGRICVIVIAMAWVSTLALSSAITVLSISIQDCLNNERGSFVVALKRKFLIENNTVALASIAVITALNAAIIRIARHQARAVAQQAREGNHPDASKTKRYLGRFLWSFVLVWLPPIIIGDCLYLTMTRRDNLDWYFVSKVVIKVFGLCQMLYGTIAMILLQEQFKDVLRSNWQFMKTKLHI
ncbi:olfactory receptor 1J1-like [Asterias amurensis]|uniref:olfactory receptor 1J1-like n=1 Tax=Asterias amurensis TaxID=7602 RepID=UPI003AB468D9